MNGNHDKGLLPAMLLIVVCIAGCAATNGEPVIPADTLLAYTPRDEVEAEEQEALLKISDTVTNEINVMRTEAENRVRAFRNAERVMHARDLPEEVERPTAKQVAALRAEALAAWKEVDRAILDHMDTFARFLEKYPNNWYARHRLAWFLESVGNWPEAARQWRRVIELAPGFPYAYNNLGSLYDHMGRGPEAAQLYRIAVALYPDEAVFHLNLAVSYSTKRYELMQMYQWDHERIWNECIAAYRRARELEPEDVQIAYDLASQYVMAPYFGIEETADEALRAWDDYLDLNLSAHKRGVACRNVGRILLTEKKEYDEAIRWLEEAVELLDDPGSKTLLERARKARAETDL
mgnify:CR=1 FL=1